MISISKNKFAFTNAQISNFSTSTCRGIIRTADFSPIQCRGFRKECIIGLGGYNYSTIEDTWNSWTSDQINNFTTDAFSGMIILFMISIIIMYCKFGGLIKDALSCFVSSLDFLLLPL
jgi:hypothetical protein